MKFHEFDIFVKKKLNIKMLKIKIDREVRKHCHDTKYYRGAAHGILRYLRCRYLMQFKVLRIQRNFFSFYNGSSYDYHFIIKKLA